MPLSRLAAIKKLSWMIQADSFPELDSNALGELIDEFVESSMGKYGRFVLDDDTKNITLINLSEMNPSDMIKTCVDALIEFSSDLDETRDTDLLNLRDEMVGLLNKLLYLLTLE